MEWSKLDLRKAAILKKECDTALIALNKVCNEGDSSKKAALANSILQRINELEEFYVNADSGCQHPHHFFGKFIIIYHLRWKGNTIREATASASPSTAKSQYCSRGEFFSFHTKRKWCTPSNRSTLRHRIEFVDQGSHGFLFVDVGFATTYSRQDCFRCGWDDTAVQNRNSNEKDSTDICLGVRHTRRTRNERSNICWWVFVRSHRHTRDVRTRNGQWNQRGNRRGRG